MDQRAPRRCQLYVMSSGLADSSRSLETRAVNERCGHRVSVDGIRSRTGYKIQCRYFEFGTAYISVSTEARLRAGRLDTQTSIPPKDMVVRFKVPHIVVVEDANLQRRGPVSLGGSWGFEESQCLQLQQSSCHGRIEGF